MRRRILIVDDEPNIVTALEYLLQQRGYDVSIARDGEEALAALARGRPDLVLLDVMMPKLNGYEVCRRIREREDWRDVRVVMLSAKGREAEVRKGMSLGADLYVTKPFSNMDLVARIETLLGQAAARPTEP